MGIFQEDLYEFLPTPVAFNSDIFVGENETFYYENTFWVIIMPF
jgi:hypothetical protein